MSDAALPLRSRTARTQTRTRLIRRASIAAVLGVGAVGGGIVASLVPVTDPGSAAVGLRRAATAPGPSVAAGPTDVIGAWLEDNGALPGEYTGPCDTTGTVDHYCSSLRDDRGDVQVHTVGLYASDLGADVLLERAAAGDWRIADARRWPELGDRYDGAPWLPLTAITAWWHDDGRAESMYGPGVVHLHDCADAGERGDQALLCSTLVEDAGTTRVYDTGRAGAPPDVRVTVVEQPDRTWTVTDTLVH